MWTQHLRDLRQLTRCALGAAVLGLAACGGGNDPTPAPPNAVPPGATASVSAWTGFVASLLPSETDDPLAVDAIEPPLSETAEPAPAS